MGEDYVVTLVAADGTIRAYGACTRGLTEEARRRHNTSPIATAALGRLMTAASMMSLSLKGEDDLLTITVDSDGPMRGMTVTADAKSGVKGYVRVPDVMLPPNPYGKLDVGGAVGKGILRVIKDLGLKDPYIGQTELVSGEIADDLTYYFNISEQVPTSVALGVLMEKNNTVKRAGGFIIQLMPDVRDYVIDSLEERLKKINGITGLLDKGMTPEDILMDILRDFEPELIDRRETGFYCNCSRGKIEKVLLSVGREELLDMIREAKPVEVKCHFCGKAYTFEKEELSRLLG